MDDKLRRVVWLTYGQRLTVLSCAARAAESTTVPDIRHDMRTIIYEVTSALYAPYFPRTQIALTIASLNLSSDSLPVRLSDHDINLLTAHGKLPRAIRQKAIPPTIIYHANGTEDRHYD